MEQNQVPISVEIASRHLDRKPTSSPSSFSNAVR